MDNKNKHKRRFTIAVTLIALICGCFVGQALLHAYSWGDGWEEKFAPIPRPAEVYEHDQLTGDDLWNTTYSKNNYTPDEERPLKYDYKGAVDKVINSMNPEWSDEMKCLYLFQIVQNTEYPDDIDFDEAYVNFNNAHYPNRGWGVLIEHLAVCGGRSYALSNLLAAASFDNMMVQVPNHAFNMVKLHNKWYFLDATQNRFLKSNHPDYNMSEIYLRKYTPVPENNLENPDDLPIGDATDFFNQMTGNEVGTEYDDVNWETKIIASNDNVLYVDIPGRVNGDSRSRDELASMYLINPLTKEKQELAKSDDSDYSIDTVIYPTIDRKKGLVEIKGCNAGNEIFIRAYDNTVKNEEDRQENIYRITIDQSGNTYKMTKVRTIYGKICTAMYSDGVDLIYNLTSDGNVKNNVIMAGRVKPPFTALPVDKYDAIHLDVEGAKWNRTLKVEKGKSVTVTTSLEGKCKETPVYKWSLTTSSLGKPGVATIVDNKDGSATITGVEEDDSLLTKLTVSLLDDHGYEYAKDECPVEVTKAKEISEETDPTEETPTETSTDEAPTEETPDVPSDTPSDDKPSKDTESDNNADHNIPPTGDTDVPESDKTTGSSVNADGTVSGDFISFEKINIHDYMSNIPGNVKFKSSNKKTAKVNKSGILTFKKMPGQVTIEAYDKSSKQTVSSCTFNVKHPSFSQKKVTMSASESMNGLTMLNTDGISIKPVWVSSKPSVAEVDANTGIITAKSKGTAKIFAVYGATSVSDKNGTRKKYKVTVKVNI